jgi:tRNA1Val (adenine37-N6)-methyltransferase
VSEEGEPHPADAPADWPADVTHDRLIGDVFIYQRRGGHRTGTDDVLTAYWATQRTTLAPHDAYLDLGCGVGSVLLMTAHRARPAECVGVEAQAESVALASRAVRELPPGFAPTRVVHSDFRELALGPRFALVTGSPPYFPTNAGVLPQDPQRLACRFELRGGVEAYCETAAATPAAAWALLLGASDGLRRTGPHGSARGRAAPAQRAGRAHARRPGGRVPERLRAGA